MTTQITGGDGLTGTIPTEFERLSNITSLGLSYNNLHGTVPTFLATLVNLGMLCFELELVLILIVVFSPQLMLPQKYVQKFSI